MAEELSYLVVQRYEGEYLHSITSQESNELIALNHIAIPAEGTTLNQDDPDSPPTITTDSTDPNQAPQQDDHTETAPLPPRNSTAEPSNEPAIPPPLNLYHGHGHAEFNSGHKYTGAFQNGFMQGRGEFIWRDGVKYEGDFSDNTITGTGEYTWKNGSKYVGEVKNGLRSGVGRFVCGGGSRGATYEGLWGEGKLNGAGKLVYNKEGTSYYEGTWLNGLKHGKGTMHYESGNVYTGDWFQNVKQGKGKMVWKDRGEEYNGDWENGLPHGKGIYTWKVSNSRNHQLPMQNTFEGDWVCGKRTGRGVFLYASGARYEGEWKDNLKHGQGNCIYENGRVFVGEFKNDRPVLEAPKFQNEYPFIFNLKDLPINASDPVAVEETLKAINNVILRHTNDLRKIYSYYCGLGVPRGKVLSNRAVTRIQLWKFFSDCKLKQKGYSFVKLDEACVSHLKNEPLFQHLYNDPHNVSHHFIFRDFLDVILRISHHIYRTATSDLSIHEHGIAAAFSHFIKADVIPNVPLDMPTPQKNEITVVAEVDEEGNAVPITTVNFGKTLFMDIEQDYGDGIYKVYTILAKKEFRKTVTIRMLLHFMNDAKMIEITPHGSLTIAKFISVFDTHIPGVVGDLGSYNLEFELVPYEMFIAFYDCLHHKTLGLLHHRAYEAARAKAEAEAAAAAALEAERIEKEMAALMAEEAAAKEAEAAILAVDALAAKEAAEKEAAERPVEVVTPVAAVAGGKKEKGEKGKAGAGGAGKKETVSAKEKEKEATAAAAAQAQKLALPAVDKGKEGDGKVSAQATEAMKRTESVANALSALRQESRLIEVKVTLPTLEDFVDPVGPTEIDIRTTLSGLFESLLKSADALYSHQLMKNTWA